MYKRNIFFVCSEITYCVVSGFLCHHSTGIMTQRITQTVINQKFYRNHLNILYYIKEEIEEIGKILSMDIIT